MHMQNPHSAKITLCIDTAYLQSRTGGKETVSSRKMQQNELCVLVLYKPGKNFVDWLLTLATRMN